MDGEPGGDSTAAVAPARRTRKIALLAATGTAAAALVATVVWVATRGPPEAPATPPPVTSSPAQPPAVTPTAALPAEPARPEQQDVTGPAPVSAVASAAPTAKAPPPPRSDPGSPTKTPAAKAQPTSPTAAPRATKGIRSIGGDLNSVAIPLESSGDGVLTVVATPWAMVAIDGRDIGETPREVRLGAGTYRVRASHPVLGTREEMVTIKAGKRQTWNPTFAN